MPTSKVKSIRVWFFIVSVRYEFIYFILKYRVYFKFTKYVIRDNCVAYVGNKALL